MKSLLEQSREPRNTIHIWRRVQWNPGHTGERRMFSALRQSIACLLLSSRPMVRVFTVSLRPHICGKTKMLWAIFREKK